ncbi:MAG: hypothetical protein KME21_08310 [Desmonostoc vinosum HA7617-LM4]|jgi:myosin heavy subunit|nr:hypothetical protein [Desmonostoc vinosum HA7617-LM4]
MNEADASKNRAVMESLNSANSTQLEQVSCPFYSVVPNENMAISQLPLLKPAEDTQPQNEVPQYPETNTQQDWVAEPDSDKQTLIDSEFQKLLTLNEELRADNSDLYKQVEQLKDDLAESEKMLQWQKTRSSVTESMLNQHNQELAAAQEQIKSLFQQLETAVQTVQRQEIFIETYKAQLQISQQRLAQLERECSLLQTNYSDQSQQLLQSETACRELRTRLMRQQRQTLQFKAALEKCLDTPVPSYDSSDDNAEHPQDITSGQGRFSRKARSLFPNAQPIKAWSAEPESLNNSDHLWGETSKPPSYKINQPAPTSDSSPWTWTNKEDDSTPVQPDSSPEVDDLNIQEDIPFSSSSSLDQQLDSLIQMFFASQQISTSSPSVEKTNVDNNIGEPIVIPVENDKNDAEPEAVSKDEFEESMAAKVIPPSKLSVEINTLVTTSTSSDAETIVEETDDYWAEISPIIGTDLSQDSSGDDANDSNPPSPVVYPQRPPKGRKSLASVELPNFRQNSQS